MGRPTDPVAVRELQDALARAGIDTIVRSHAQWDRPAVGEPPFVKGTHWSIHLVDTGEVDVPLLYETAAGTGWNVTYVHQGFRFDRRFDG
jgi:hypothetical protein